MKYYDEYEYYDSEYSEISEYSDDTDDTSQLEVYSDVKEQDDFDNFLECFFEARNYFYFMKWINACDVYNLIRELHTLNPVDGTLEEGDYYWCSNLIYSTDPEYTVTDERISTFFLKLVQLI